MNYPVLDLKATGERINQLRKDNNLRVIDVAEYMGFESTQAVYKWQRGRMVTTEQHLKDNLNAGKITQEEYDEYYPLDGLEDSYYSVFVNVDLNKATTTSGRVLGSEEEIAQYIADMLLLESDSVFNICYTGTTKTSGETFYEFRCYR